MRSQHVRPSLPPTLGVQQGARVLQQPRYQCVPGGNVLAQTCFQTKRKCAEKTSPNVNAYLNTTVALRLVGRRAFSLHFAHGLPFFQRLSHAMLERHNGSLIVCFDDDLGVP